MANLLSFKDVLGNLTYLTFQDFMTTFQLMINRITKNRDRSLFQVVVTQKGRGCNVDWT